MAKHYSDEFKEQAIERVLDGYITPEEYYNQLLKKEKSKVA